MNYEIEIYQTDQNLIPFYIWLEELDITERQKIRVRIRRLSFGNFSNSEPLKDGVYEIKIDSGPGYRIYYSMLTLKKILILWAGTKRTQSKDIIKAKEYFKNYKMRGEHYGKK